MSFRRISPKDKKTIRELLGEESTCVFEPTEYQRQLLEVESFSLNEFSEEAEETVPEVASPEVWLLTNLIPDIPKYK